MFAGLLPFLGGQIWLVLIIMRGSPFAALLCLVIPFLVLLFVRDHWEEARPAVITWSAGLLLCLVGGTILKIAMSA